MFKRFLASLSGTLTDELEQAKQASFIDLVVLLERRLKRSLGANELRVVWSMDDSQTEVITNLLEEANVHETTSNP
jgi:hypothetical protein